MKVQAGEKGCPVETLSRVGKGGRGKGESRGWPAKKIPHTAGLLEDGGGPDKKKKKTKKKQQKKARGSQHGEGHHHQNVRRGLERGLALRDQKVRGAGTRRFLTPNSLKIRRGGKTRKKRITGEKEELGIQILRGSFIRRELSGAKKKRMNHEKGGSEDFGTDTRILNREVLAEGPRKRSRGHWKKNKRKEKKSRSLGV